MGRSAGPVVVGGVKPVHTYTPHSFHFHTPLLRPFPSLVQDCSEFEPHSFPALPTVTIQPAVAPPSPPVATPETGIGQPRARALRIGAQISELSNLLHSQPCFEQELRGLQHNLVHLATILKVPRVDLRLFLTTTCALTLAFPPRTTFLC